MPLPTLTSQPTLNLPNKDVDDKKTNENLHTIERWGDEALKPISIELYHTTDVAVPAGGVITPMTWPTTDVVRDTTVDATHPKGLFLPNSSTTILIPMNGDYNFTFQCKWDLADHTGLYRIIQLRRTPFGGGGPFISASHYTDPNAGYSFPTLCIEKFCRLGEQFQIAFLQDGAGPNNVTAGVEFSIRWHVAKRGA